MKNLCFAGGGMKGICYIGIYKYLIEHNILKDVENISGTSIGSIISVLIILKYSVEELSIMVENLTKSLIEDIDIKNCLSSYSIDSGKKIGYIVKKIFTHKGFHKDITFIELYRKTNIGLHLCSTCLNDYSRHIFNHIKTPDMKVVNACLYSINIPFLWSSDKINDNYYIDGCLSTNLPIEDFPKENTLGFFCKNDKTDTSIENINDYFIKVMKCILHRANVLELKTYQQEGYNIIVIDIPPIENLDLGMSRDLKRALISRGYDCISKYFNLKTNK